MHLQIVYLTPYLSMMIVFASALLYTWAPFVEVTNRLNVSPFTFAPLTSISEVESIQLRIVRLVRRKLLATGDDEIPHPLFSQFISNEQ